MSETPESAPQVERPGQVLKRAREAKNLTVAAIATQMNLDLRIVEALEAGDQSKLPAPIFVRGYLRGYARLVNVPEDAVLDAYQAQAPQEPVPRRVGMASAPMRPALRRSSTPWGGLLVVALLIVAAVAGFVQGPQLIERFIPANETADAPAHEEPASGLTLTLPQSAPATPEISGEPLPDISGDTSAEGSPDTSATSGELALPLPAPAPEAARDPVQQPVPEPVLPPEDEFGIGEGAGSGTERAAEAATPSAPQPADTASTQTPSAESQPAATQTPSPDGHTRLTFRFGAQSWVEVRSADGEKLLFGLYGGGETREVSGKAPISVLLGNAASVALSVDGRPFDVAAHNRNNIARFRIEAPGESR